MTRGVRNRLILFVLLGAVGILYVTSSYLGLIDKVLGTELSVHVRLPSSGGLYVSGEVDYRGVKIGRVSGMHVTRDGVLVDLTLKPGTKLPVSSPVFVHDLSAVGEQYVNFEPSSTAGPYARNGTVFTGSQASLPQTNAQLLGILNSFVHSVDGNVLSQVIGDLGTAFNDTATPLRSMVDDGSRFIAAAQANQPQTVSLFETGLRVLKTQQANAANIRGFARDMANLTDTLRVHDGDVRTILQGGGIAAREVNGLLKDLQPTMPVFLSNLVTVNQVVAVRLPAVEQLLVTFPRLISSGFTGTPGDGFGYINMQFNNSVAPCTQGYKPPSQWRPGTDLSDGPIYPAKCLAGPPYDMRGNRYAPHYGGTNSVGHDYGVSTYDPRTGKVDSANVGKVTIGSNTAVFGDHAWEWLLLGPRPQQ